MQTIAPNADTLAKVKRDYLEKVANERPLSSLYVARCAMDKLPAVFSAVGFSEWRSKLIQTYKPETVNRYISEARSFFHYARKMGFWEITRDNIADHLEYVTPEEKTPTYMEPRQISALLARATVPDGYKHLDKMLFVAFGLFLGARPGELLTIQGKDIRLESREVIVRASKTNRARRVPFDDSVILRKIMPMVAGFNGPIIRLKPRGRWFKALADDLGLPASDKNLLRRTCACYSASSGLYTQYMLAEKFGHSMKTAQQFYLVPIRGLKGDRQERWMGCEQAAGEFLDALVAEIERKAGERVSGTEKSA